MEQQWFYGPVERYVESTASSLLARACDLSVHDSQRGERQVVLHDREWFGLGTRGNPHDVIDGCPRWLSIPHHPLRDETVNGLNRVLCSR